MMSSSLYEYYCDLIVRYQKICEDHASRHDRLSYERAHNILIDLKDAFHRMFHRAFSKTDRLTTVA